MPTLPESECATYLITSKGRKVYSFSRMLGIERDRNGYAMGLYTL